MLVIPFLVAFLIGLCSAFYFYRKLRAHQVFAKESIPGPEPNWLFGNALEFVDATTRHLVLPKWTKIYGKIYGYYEGPQPTLVISDVDFVTSVFVKNFDSFHGRKLMPLQANGDDMEEEIPMLFASGERWKRLRTICNPAFSAMKLRGLMPVINKYQRQFLHLVDEEAAKDEPFDIHECYRLMTMDIIAESAFSIQLNSIKTLGKENPFIETIEEMFKAIGKPPHTLMLGTILPEVMPLLRAFELFRAKVFNAGFLKGQLALGELTRKLFDARKAVCGENKCQDLLQMLIERESSGCLSIEEAIGQAGLLLVTGYEAPSNALAFVTFMLANHPEVQEKLIAEIDTYFADFPVDKCADYPPSADMPYLECVINETQRLYPFAPLMVNRVAMTDTVVDGINIPKGVAVAADVWSIHRDEEQWGPVDTEKFYPERFQDDYPSTHNRRDAAFMPFGFGPRICLGMRFALLEIKLTLVNLLRKYRIVKCEKTGDRVELNVALTIAPANGVWIKLEKRND